MAGAECFFGVSSCAYGFEMQWIQDNGAGWLGGTGQLPPEVGNTELVFALCARHRREIRP
jgi:hypothetical protein